MSESVKKFQFLGIPSKYPSISKAEVGQTVVVKAVDENGKPTEWESASIPDIDPIVCSDSGEVVTVNDASNHALKGLTLYGKTTQFTTTGKNLFNVIGTGYLSNLDGSITAMDTSNVTDYIPIAEGVSQITYLVPNYASDMENVFAIRIGWYDADYGWLLNNIPSTTCAIYDVPSGAKYFRCSATSTAKVCVMYGAGTISDYEPYTGGMPSPNPDYPQELESLGDGGSVGVNVCSGNIWDPKLLQVDYIDGGIETEIVDGRVHFRGDATADRNFRFIEPNAANYGSSGTITLSAQNIDGPMGDILVSRCKNDVWNTVATLNALNNYTATVELGDYDIIPFLCFKQGITYDTYFDFVINYGETALPYEPYKSQTHAFSTPNGLPGIPVSSDGNYTDANSQQWICDEVDLARGVYVQRIRQYDISGNENWVKSSLVVNGYSSFYCNSLVADITENSAKLCTHFQGGYSYEWNNLSAREFIQNPSGSGKNNVGIRVLASRLASDDVSGFKTFLREKNVSFQYILETPIETPLSAEEIATFKALHTNKPNTTVYTDSNAGIKLDYVADTKTYIDNKFAELSTE